MNEIKSLAKGLKILDILNQKPEQSFTVGSLARALDVNKSSASRLIKTLANYNYVQKEASSRAYVLGPKMQNCVDSARANLREQAQAFIYQLMKLSGECSHTAIYANGQALIISDIEPETSLKVSGGIGRSEELHCTAVGKCLLAFLDLEIPQNLTKKTAKTISSKKQLEKHINQIIEKGYALDDEENYLGVRCLAAPVYNAQSKVVACIGISGPTVRITPDRIQELAELTMQTAWDLSKHLAHKNTKG